MQSSSRIQLETILGFNGSQYNVLKIHPTTPEVLVRAIGGKIVCANLKTGEQRFVKLHDMEITTLALSPDGKYAATGQKGTVFKREPDAPIILTDLATLKPFHTFDMIKHGVIKVDFSEDGQFLAATGEDNRFIIWNMSDKSVVTSLVQERQYIQFTWLKKITGSKYPSYTFVASTKDRVYLWTLHFDLGCMKYFSKSEQITLPSSGLVRQYYANIKDETDKWYFAGTAGGELCIFDMENKLFKASIQVGSTAITTLAFCGGYVLAGLGNGHLFKLQGKDTVWNIIGSLELQSAVQNITVHSTGAVFVGTEDCSIYFINLKEWKASIYTSGHAGGVTDMDLVGSSQQGMFATVDTRGTTIVWDKRGAQNDMFNQVQPFGNKNVGGSCVSLEGHERVCTGFVNGAVISHKIDANLVAPKVEWDIPQAHKGAVTSLVVDQNYILTGGEDGLIRVWSKGLRKIISQLNFHTKAVTRIIPDFQSANIIHSCSVDKQVQSYDLKAEKKLMYHTAKNGHLLDITQKRTPEFEIVSVGFNNPITYWDIDVVAPTAEIQAPAQKCNCVDISPSGKYFLVGTEDCMIYCYDATAKKIIAQTNAHSQGLTRIKWLSDEQGFVSCS